MQVSPSRFGVYLSDTAQLVNRLYQAAPALRETVVTAMLTHCFPQVVTAQPSSAATHSRKAGARKDPFGLPALRPLGESAPQVGVEATEEGGYYRQPKLQRRLTARASAGRRQLAYRRAIVAVTVLETLCESHASTRDAVLRALLGRLTQQAADSAKVLPCAGILRRYVVPI
jgi:hypothetical protein